MAGDGAGSPGLPAESPDRGTDAAYDAGRSPPPMTTDHESGAEDRARDEAPLDFSTRKRISDEEDDDDDDDSNLSAEHSLSPPPLLNRDQVGRDDANYRPGPTVFPHMNGMSFSPPMPKPESCVSPRQAVKEKIGEPQTASPGMVPGMTMPSAAQMHGLLPGFPPAGFLPQSGLLSAALPFLQLDPRAAQMQAMKQQNKNGLTRPFKAYPKEPLSLPLGEYGLPGLPGGISPADIAAAQAMSVNSEELFNQYKLMIQHMQGDVSPGSRRPNPPPTQPPQQQQPPPPPPQQKAVKERRSSDGSTSSQVSSTSALSEQGSPALPSMAPQHLNGVPVPPPLQLSPHHTPSKASLSANSRKRPRSIPDELKDTAYWERRRKNNEAAKRSRDARRAKEDEIAIRAAFLEQENLKLRVEVAALKNETSKLRCMLYNS
jgi:hypothetical protein